MTDIKQAGSSAGDADVLVIGATGMLGSALVFELPALTGLSIHGTVRDLARATDLVGSPALQNVVLHEVDVTSEEHVERVLADVKPSVVINAVGTIEQSPDVRDGALAVRLNGLLPHLLSGICEDLGSRLIHISTDCVFSGRRGMYAEDDLPDPVDLYGRSKLVGEVETPNLTLRTSIIGPELRRHKSLLDWFLSQSGKRVKGFDQAIYSGVPTVELARFIATVALPQQLSGLYQLASTPISKYELLKLIAATYSWDGELERDTEFRCDRSLSGRLLEKVTGYRPPEWPLLIDAMYGAHVRWHGQEANGSA